MQRIFPHELIPKKKHRNGLKTFWQKIIKEHENGLKTFWQKIINEHGNV
ncbi:44915_t:CDS:2 [Gigaspora margarita]|uniref:44915_t:CDS:1 n=1 Tax=Gigaspora margarita TaxID=4874 RepID=A0ABN7UUJ1_GIGMA|nr:44915_t:CDS:2 [Gigaspora margarita]